MLAELATPTTELLCDVCVCCHSRLPRVLHQALRAGPEDVVTLEACAACLLDVAQTSVCQLGAAFGHDLLSVAGQHVSQAAFGTPAALLGVLRGAL